MHRFVCKLTIIFVFLSWLAPVFAASEPLQRPFLLAVHPYLPSEEIQRRFTPLAEYLGRVLGRQVVVRVGQDYEAHIAAIGTNSVDMAFMGPAPYIKLVQRYGQKPLLGRIETNGKPYLSGTIITRTDSSLRSIADLRGKTFAFGDPDSTMSSLIPRYVLLQAGVPLKALARYEHLGAHKNVALGVLGGDYDAGAVKIEVFDEFASRGLRVLAALPPVSEHLFVTRGDMPPEQVRMLREALLKVKAAPNGEAIIKAINQEVTGIVPVADRDYDNLRTILHTLEVTRD